MNGRGGYCIARYGYGGGGGGMYSISKVDSIMLKFRPIAPKPVPPGSGSAASKPDNNNQYVNCGRSKRKYVRVNKIKKKNDNCNKKLKVKPSSPSKPVITLPLLPETPDRKENKPVTGFSDLLSLSPTTSAVQKTNGDYEKNNLALAPAWLSCNAGVIAPAAQPQRRTPVVSKVTVESVTDTWVDLEGLRLGCTDEDRVVNLEKDTCPGFISDGQDRVVWTNEAYRQMARGEDMAVVLVWKDKWVAPAVTCTGFTCKVKAQVTASATHGDGCNLLPCCSTMTVPCDVWRMHHGGCAWRLDVKAALSLGR